MLTETVPSTDEEAELVSMASNATDGEQNPARMLAERRGASSAGRAKVAVASRRQTARTRCDGDKHEKARQAADNKAFPPPHGVIKPPYDRMLRWQRRLPESKPVQTARGRDCWPQTALGRAVRGTTPLSANRDQSTSLSASLMSLTKSCKFIASLGEGSKPKCS